jgi:hypothetical protein
VVEVTTGGAPPNRGSASKALVWWVDVVALHEDLWLVEQQQGTRGSLYRGRKGLWRAWQGFTFSVSN